LKKKIVFCVSRKKSAEKKIRVNSND
jgi:hypothetical protein